MVGTYIRVGATRRPPFYAASIAYIIKMHFFAIFCHFKLVPAFFLTELSLWKGKDDFPLSLVLGLWCLCLLSYKKLHKIWYFAKCHIFLGCFIQNFRFSHGFKVTLTLSRGRVSLTHGVIRTVYSMLLVVAQFVWQTVKKAFKKVRLATHWNMLLRENSRQKLCKSTLSKHFLS